MEAKIIEVSVLNKEMRTTSVLKQFCQAFHIGILGLFILSHAYAPISQSSTAESKSSVSIFDIYRTLTLSC
jgi:hypothetical protein